MSLYYLQFTKKNGKPQRLSKKNLNSATVMGSVENNVQLLQYSAFHQHGRKWWNLAMVNALHPINNTEKYKLTQIYFC